MGPHASICLPSVRHGKTGFEQAEIVRKLDSDLNRSSVDTEGVVSRFGRTSDRASSFPSGSLGPPVSVACQEVPPLLIKACLHAWRLSSDLRRPLASCQMWLDALLGQGGARF